MTKYLLIARELICGITNDKDLDSLNGLFSTTFIALDDQDFFDILDHEIDKIKREYPNSHFENYEVVKISA